MISQLTGQIEYQGDNFIILNVSGVGYKIFASIEVIETIKSKENTEIKLWTHLAVRENSMDLYGFLEKAELNFFELLITISGIGPKTALGILNVATVSTLISAISTEDTSYLTKVSGIGEKNAQKIILELKNKIQNIEGISPKNIEGELDTIDALKALGYSTREITDALQQIDKSIIDVGEKVKEVIKYLGSNNT
ncbi:MAG: Holliday junction branch migration protein RuvA [Candidatus Pacebacteria bacterium]|nr:Holliday junction branch migration protein RuvA [Candidatus Paceibacterota bacterium]